MSEPMVVQTGGETHAVNVPDSDIEVLRALMFLERWNQAELILRGLHALVLGRCDDPLVQRAIAIARGEPEQPENIEGTHDG